MNRSEAKNLLANIELVKAFAEGQHIQYRCAGHKAWDDVSCPTFVAEDCEYRIKPRPTEGWVNLYKDGTTGSIWPTRKSAEEHATSWVMKCVFVREVEGK